MTSGLLSCTPCHFLKKIYSKRKEFAPLGSKFFPFRVDPKGSKLFPFRVDSLTEMKENNLKELSPSKVICSF